MTSNPSLRRVAVVTPVYREPLHWIHEAMASVAAQSHACTHVLVADGVKRDDLDPGKAILLELETPTNDGGGTPRTVGGRWAIENNHDVIAYLDADDILEPEFLTDVFRAMDAGFDCVTVPARRVTTANEALTLRDGSPAVTWVPYRHHVGQGELCFIRAGGIALTGQALTLGEVWARIPRKLGGTCDLFWSWAAFASPARIAWTLRPTYRYRLTNADVYRTYGLAAPADADTGKSDLHHAHHAAWNTLDHDEKAEVLARIGISKGYRITREDAEAMLEGITFSDRLLALDQNRRFHVA